ncbi:MAG: hypothetical protein AAGJ97_08060, partial [Planctomycetota bacterium]
MIPVVLLTIAAASPEAGDAPSLIGPNVLKDIEIAWQARDEIFASGSLTWEPVEDGISRFGLEPFVDERQGGRLFWSDDRSAFITHAI